MSKPLNAIEITAKLRYFLEHGNNELLCSYIESIGIEALFDPKLIDAVRNIGFPEVVIFLATISVSNNKDVDRNTIILHAYQSLLQQQVKAELRTPHHSSIIEQALDGIINESCAIKPPPLTTLFMHWLDAILLSIDHLRFDLARDIINLFVSNRPSQQQLKYLMGVIIERSRFIKGTENWLNFAHCLISLDRIFTLRDNLAFNDAIQVIISTALLNAHQHKQAQKYANKIKNFCLDEKLILLTKIKLFEHEYIDAIHMLDRFYETFMLIKKPHSVDNLLPQLNQSKNDFKDFNSQAAKQTISDFKSILDDINVKPFLVSGTLLGYERTGAFLSHDKDIDIGIIGQEHQYEVVEALVKSNKFSVDFNYIKGQETYVIPIVHKATGISIDMFFYHYEQDLLVTGINSEWGYIQKFGFTPLTLNECEFLGVNFYVPSDVDLNLAENYGNWRVPDPGYIAHLESPSMLEKGGLIHILIGRLMLAKALKENDLKKAIRILKVMRDYKSSPYAIHRDLEDKIINWCHGVSHHQQPELIEA